MNLLAIDTTTDVCAIAVHRQDLWFEHNRFAPRLHNQHVLPMVASVLDAADLTVIDLDLIAFGAGPGSFTGVRIGAAVSQGIALACDAKLVPVANSAVAAEALRRIGGRRGEVEIVRASRPGWLYRARYQLGDAGVTCIQFDRLISAGEVDDSAVATDQLPVSAHLVGALALRNIDSAVAPAFAQPYYVDGDSPWQPTGSAAGRPLPESTSGAFHRLP